MQHRHVYDTQSRAEAQEVRDRRDLVMQMVEHFKNEGIITPYYSEDEADVLYTRVGGSQERVVLFENPDEGAVHVLVGRIHGKFGFRNSYM